MHISVIIPAFNSEATLKRCLSSVFNSDYKDFEIVLVNDASTDSTAEIAKSFPCKIISNKTTLGRAVAKNIGVDQASGFIVVFIDSDVIIEKDALQIIHNSFYNKPAIAAVTGVPTADNPYHNFASQYKSIYMNYIFSKLPSAVDFLCGSIQAFNKSLFWSGSLKFSKGFYCDDIDVGLQMNKKDMNILLNRDIKFTHMRYHSIRSLIKNDYLVPSEFAQLFLKHGSLQHSIKKKRFAHTSILQIISVAVSLAIVIAAFGTLTRYVIFDYLVPSLIFLHLMLNLGFYSFICKKKGGVFLAKAMVFNPLDQTVMGLGIIGGTIKCVKDCFSA